MKATTRITYNEPKNPREVESLFLTETSNKARVTYVWADADVNGSYRHPVEMFSTTWVYELEWDV